MSHLAISLLGSFHVTLDGNPVTLKSDKARALLAYLAVRSHTHANAPCQREVLAGLLWPDQPDKSARHNLRQALNQLRNAIADRDTNRAAGTPFLRVMRGTIQFNPESDYWLDVAAFNELVDACATHRHRRPDACRACARRLREAVDIYRGDFMAGFSLDSALYEEWLVVRREELHHQALDALHSLAGYHCRRREYGLAIAHARRQVALEPWREGAHRQWMRALALNGGRSAALAQYEACRRALREELGIGPAEETTALYERIRDGTEQQFAAPHNLPAPLTPFVGRKAALAEIAQCLQDPDCRLLSLVGPGGIGKTHLALEAARGEVGGYDHGVFLVSLAPIRSADPMVSTVAQALGFSFSGRGDNRRQLLNYLREKQMLLLLDNFEHLLARPPDTSSRCPPVRTSGRCIGRTPGRCEATPITVIPSGGALFAPESIAHGHSASPDLGGRNLYDSERDPSTALRSTRDDERSLSSDFAATLVTDILQAALGVQILATSRERLGLSSETVFAVGGIDYPGLGAGEDALGFSAVQLYLQGARRVHPGLDLRADDLEHVVRVCHLVQGMPLAILLAATWMDVLSPAAIADRIERGLDFLQADLRDVPDRHRSMRAVFDASWMGLRDAERGAFAGLSVFRGGFTDDAAQHVAGADLRTLKALLQKCFLQRDESGRYGVHELLRQYAWSKLGERPGEREKTRDRHCAYYAEFLAANVSEIERRRLAVALPEMDNIRAASRWALERRKVGAIRKFLVGLFGGLHELWYIQGWIEEGEALFGEIVDVLRACEPTGENKMALGIALRSQGLFSSSRRETAVRLLRESASILSEIGAWQELVLTNNWGYLVRGAKDDEVGLLRESLALCREIGFQWGQAWTFELLVEVALLRETYQKAERYAQSATRIAREIGSLRGTAWGLYSLSSIAYLQGEYLKAREFGEESLALFREFGWQLGMALALDLLGAIVLAMGEYEEAERCYRKALVIKGREDHQKKAGSLVYLAEVAVAKGDYSVARERYRQALEIAMDRQAVEEQLEFLVGMSMLLGRERGAPSSVGRAVELVALALRHFSEYQLDARAVFKAQRHLDELRAALPPDVFAAAQARGRARDLDATVAELLTELQEKT